MKLSCFRKDLHEGLQTVARAVSGRTSLPILGNVLLEATESGLRLAATDLEIAIERSVTADVKEPGRITLPAKQFAEIIAALPEASVWITDKAGTVEVTCFKSNYRLQALAAEDYPALPEVGSEVSFSDTQRELKESLKQVLIAVSSEDNRPILTGVYTLLGSGQLTLVATDTHRLALREHRVAAHSGEGAVIIPGRAITEVCRLMGDEGEVRFQADQNQARFSTPLASVTTRLIEGTFPKYERVIPTEYSRRVILSRFELQQAAKRLAIIARSGSHRVVLSTQDAETVQLAASAADLGEACEPVDAQVEGDDIQIAFNVHYLLDALDAIRHEQVELQMTEPLRPVLIKPYEREGFSYTLMPMSLQ